MPSCVVKIQKINHVTMNQSVNDIPDCPTNDQPDCRRRLTSWGTQSPKCDKQHEKHDEIGNQEKKVHVEVGIGKKSKGSAFVVDQHQIEKTGDCSRTIGFQVKKDGPFRDLINDHDEQCDATVNANNSFAEFEWLAFHHGRRFNLRKTRIHHSQLSGKFSYLSGAFYILNTSKAYLRMRRV